MPAAKTRKAKKPSKPAKKSRPASRPAPKARKARPAPAKRASPAPRTAAAAFHHERTHCAAIDPFGDPCQTSPRYGSKYCAVHSHLER